MIIKGLQQQYYSKIIVLAICLCIIFLTRCMNKEAKEKNVISKNKYEDFAGSVSCQNCHKEITTGHIHTAHFLTTQPASANNIKGSFLPGENVFAFTNRLEVVMEKRIDKFYQAAYLDGVQKNAKPFDILVGSGTKGQSYMYWKGNKLFQLPITYFAPLHQWSNSPGYPGMVVYNRPITSRCLECHSTYFEKTSEDEIETEEFDRTKIIYGVDCEKCHGPAASHVKYHQQNPNDKNGKFIINTGKLSRQQNLDLCTLCHGGNLTKSKPSFTFKAGEYLANYFVTDSAKKFADRIDVHGNQYGLLSSSKCFLNSQMTCSSCHNSHENERNNITLFSQRCMHCHNASEGNFCKVKVDHNINIQNNCIDCHMPRQLSMSIAVFLQGDEVPTPALLRTHLLKIYPDETKKYIEEMKKQPQRNK